MNNVLILHGTNGNSHENWFSWLKAKMEETGYDVWVPDLPDSNYPNIKRYNEYIFSNEAWKFHEHTEIIGHSSGAVAALGVLQNLPGDVVINKVILVGSFKDDLGWPNLGGLFDTPFDFEKIKKHCKKFILIHSDDDPYCPLEGAKYLCEKLEGEIYVFPGQKHFSVTAGGEKFRKFPEILKFL